MFWVIIKDNTGFIGVALPDRFTGRITNYIPDDKYEPLIGKTFLDLSSMYHSNTKFEQSDLYLYLTDKFDLVDTFKKGVLSFYKFDNK